MGMNKDKVERTTSTGCNFPAFVHSSKGTIGYGDSSGKDKTTHLLVVYVSTDSPGFLLSSDEAEETQSLIIALVKKKKKQLFKRG